MKNKRFVTDVLNLMPDFGEVSGYFFLRDYEHILSGFYCENTPRGAYIWRFVYPLFDRADIVHLTFSSRLQGSLGYIDYDEYTKKQLAREFLSRVSGNINLAKQTLSLPGFKSYIEENNSLLNNPIVRRVYALALVLLDEFEEAKNNLVVAMDSKAMNLDGSFFSECRLLLQLLDDDVDNAKVLIERWEGDKKLNLQLEERGQEERGQSPF